MNNTDFGDHNFTQIPLKGTPLIDAIESMYSLSRRIRWDELREEHSNVLASLKDVDTSHLEQLMRKTETALLQGESKNFQLFSQQIQEEIAKISQINPN